MGRQSSGARRRARQSGRREARQTRRAEVEAFAKQWLGKRLVTIQTDEHGQPVSKIYVESCTDIERELYLGAVIDRASRRVVFMSSTEGGVEIEKVADETPEKIIRTTIDPFVGAQPFQGREIAFALGLKGDAGESVREPVRQSVAAVSRMRLFAASR